MAFFEVHCPSWVDGKPLTVQHVEAEWPEDADEKARHRVVMPPQAFLTVRRCDCELCRMAADPMSIHAPQRMPE
jgi:hypothetical protein